ncbi:MAG: ATP-binding protein [Parabacteroides sp.]|nr:ATP-binding protein [Parabacteroides sp.]
MKMYTEPGAVGHKSEKGSKKPSLRETVLEVLSILLQSHRTKIIDDALYLILKYFEVDRVYIGILSHKAHTLDITHEVTTQGVYSFKEEILTQIPLQAIPWWIEKIKQNQDIIINNVELMSPKSSREQELLRQQDIYSLLTTPIVEEKRPVGFIGLDSVKICRKWKQKEIEDLHLLANIISIALERREIHFALEQLALEEKNKFLDVFNKMPWGAELYNENGYLVDVNPAELDILGTTRRQLVGINLFDSPCIPKDKLKALAEENDIIFDQYINFDQINASGYYLSSFQGTVKYLRVKLVRLTQPNGNTSGYIAIVIDDTEKQRQQEQIQENLTQLKIATDTGKSFFWQYNVKLDQWMIRKDLIQTYNQDSDIPCKLWNKKEILNSIHPEDKERIRAQFTALRQGTVDRYTSTYRRLYNGKTLWFSTNAQIHKRDKEGNPLTIIGYSSNITESQNREIELVKAKEADQLKSVFIANMSHEIRTPLNAIVGFSDIVAETEDPEERQTYLDIIHKNNDLLLQLINDILDFSKIEAGTLDYNLAPVDLKDICLNVSMSQSLRVKDDVRLIFDSHSPALPLQTDEKRIEQVLSNLVGNAIKFTSEGSITISYIKEENHVKVFVKDTGCGIAPKNQQRVFERFVKENNFRPGTGLGLAISKNIVERLGGQIGVESADGQGSTFWFTLPLAIPET